MPWANAVPEAATPAGYGVPVVMVWGQGGPTCPGALGKLSLRCDGGPGCLQRRYSGKAEVRESGGPSTRGDALQLFLPRLVLVSNRAHGWTSGSAASGGAESLQNRTGTANIKARVGSNLLPKAQAGTQRMPRHGDAEGPLKISSSRLWFSRRMPGLSSHGCGFSGGASACREPAGLCPHQTLPTGLRANSDRYEGPTATGVLGGGGREKRGGQTISSATNANINTSESCNKNLLP